MKRHIFNFRISQVAPFIDWSYFLHAWGIATGNENTQAKEIIADARAILAQAGDRYSTKAIFALCDAKADGDNIIIEGTTLPLLRQQHCKEGAYNLCLSDFVSPHGDSIGLFATSVESKFGKGFTGDEYQNLIAQTLADRLAEATATLLHKKVRTEKRLWGYAPEEKLTVDDLLAERNQGIRPAVGYPSLPDQSIIFTIDSLLRLSDAGITLTPNGAMMPHASVCGVMIAHPAAQYFTVGRIDREQLEDYSTRRGVAHWEIEKFLAKNLG